MDIEEKAENIKKFTDEDNWNGSSRLLRYWKDQKLYIK